MFKRIFLLLMGIGLGAASAKIISDHYRAKGKSSILSALYEAKEQFEFGEITEAQYRETIKALHNLTNEYDRKKINKLLEEKYFIAEEMANEHAELMNDITASEAASLLDYIERFPHEAYVIGVIELDDYSSENENIFPEEAERIMKKYIQRITDEKADIIREIIMLDGDEDRIRHELDKIAF